MCLPSSLSETNVLFWWWIIICWSLRVAWSPWIVVCCWFTSSSCWFTVSWSWFTVSCCWSNWLTKWETCDCTYIGKHRLMLHTCICIDTAALNNFGILKLLGWLLQHKNWSRLQSSVIIQVVYHTYSGKSLENPHISRIFHFIHLFSSLPLQCAPYLWTPTDNMIQGRWGLAHICIFGHF